MSISRTPSQKAALVTANVLPIYRAYRGPKTAERLRTDMHDPADRTWKFAGRVAGDALTDKADGILARYAGKTKWGGTIDQLADKAWYWPILKQLVTNGELDPYHLKVTVARDIGVSGMRYVGNKLGLETDARKLAQLKTVAQMTGVVAICSPLAHEEPEFVKNIFEVATSASLVSGLEMAHSYTVDLRSRHEDNLASRLIVASLADIELLAA